MHSIEKEVSSYNKVILYFKIIAASAMVFLGIYFVVWLIDTINIILFEPESISILQSILNYDSKQQLLKVSYNNETAMVGYNDFMKYGILIAIAFLIFIIIGKVFTAIFTSITSIISSLSYIHPKEKTDSNTPSDFVQ